MKSPIQLKQHVILKVQLEPRLTESDDEMGESKTSHFINVSRSPDDDHQWLAQVGVKIEDEDESTPAPYIGEIIVAGSFDLDPQFPEEKAETMVRFNSGSILYGAIRELVLSLTSRSVHGDLVLPTVDARMFLTTEE